MFTRSYTILLLALTASCGTASNDSTVYGQSGTGGGGGSGGANTDGGSTGGTTGDASPGIDAMTVPDGTTEPGKLLVYAHNDTTLYSVDPTDPNLALTQIGKFDCIGGSGEDPSMTDIAVDKDGGLFGVSATAVYLDMKVNGSSVGCQAAKVTIDAGSVGTNAKFYGLTFAPPTQALGTAETLIGANSNGDLYAIDKATGQLTIVGNFGKVPSNDGQGHTYPSSHVDKNWELSGDIVFLANNGSPLGFATVRDCPNPPSSSSCSTVDTLVEIDVPKLAFNSSQSVTKAVRGQVLPANCSDPQSCGFGSMYGIAAWGDQVYGFSRKGDLLTINNATGVGVKIGTPLTTPPSSNGFAGAGVTTLAPVIAPPPK